MLDIETLGPAPDGVILQIGACEFELGTQGFGKTFCVNVSRDSCLEEGLRVHPSTEAFWAREENQEAWKTLQEEPNPLWEALLLFRTAFKWESMQGVWTNAPLFDFAILRHAYRAVNLEVPWHYRQERDSRTLMAVVGELNKMPQLPERQGTHHNALDDAVYQALVCSALFNALR